MAKGQGRLEVDQGAHLHNGLSIDLKRWQESVIDGS